MKCINHPEREVDGACVYCGKLFCSDCLVEADGKLYCKSDVGKALKEAKEEVAASKSVSPNIVINNANTNMNTNNNTAGGMAYPYKSKLVALPCFLVFWSAQVLCRQDRQVLWLLTGGLCGVAYRFYSHPYRRIQDKANMPLK